MTIGTASTTFSYDDDGKVTFLERSFIQKPEDKTEQEIVRLFTKPSAFKRFIL